MAKTSRPVHVRFCLPHLKIGFTQTQNHIVTASSTVKFSFSGISFVRSGSGIRVSDTSCGFQMLLISQYKKQNLYR